MKIKELKAYYRKGSATAYAWPGGYPVFYLCSDGGCLCPNCATKKRAQIFRSTYERSHDGWAIAGVDVNWEDPEMFCDNCNARIESAYAEDVAEHGSK
jgi:hypothetical protein